AKNLDFNTSKSQYVRARARASKAIGWIGALSTVTYSSPRLSTNKENARVCVLPKSTPTFQNLSGRGVSFLASSSNPFLPWIWPSNASIGSLVEYQTYLSFVRSVNFPI